MSLEKYYPLGDYDEGSQFSLNEAEWHSYLSAVDAEAGKFLRLFILIRHISNQVNGEFITGLALPLLQVQALLLQPKATVLITMP